MANLPFELPDHEEYSRLSPEERALLIADLRGWLSMREALDYFDDPRSDEQKQESLEEFMPLIQGIKERSSVRKVIGIDEDATRYRCYLNGEEISDRCFGADEEEGWADVYVVDRNGKKVAPVRTERLYGQIRLERMADS